MNQKNFLWALLLAICLPICGMAQLTYAAMMVQYDSPWTYKNLQLIPIRFKGVAKELPGRSGENGSLSLKEALARGKVKLREMTGERGADLNVLQVVNISKQNIVAPAGDLLQGGKQDRMVGETTIIPPGSTAFLNVYCIEKGRWDDKAAAFQHAGTAGLPLRKVMDRTGRQHEVWKEIEKQFAGVHTVTQTWAYLNLRKKIDTLDTAYFNYFKAKLGESDSAYAGFLAVTGNNILNCELFSSADVLHMSFPSMLNSWIESSLRGATPVLPQKDKQSFMDQLLGSEESQRAFIATNGRREKYLDKVIHVIAYGD